MNPMYFKVEHPVRSAALVNALVTIPSLFMVPNLNGMIIVTVLGVLLGWGCVGVSLAGDHPIVRWVLGFIRFAMALLALLVICLIAAIHFRVAQLERWTLRLMDTFIVVAPLIYLVGCCVLAIIGWWHYARRSKPAHSTAERQ